MKIAQTLRRPANWQDFESLCLLLWREEWKSDDLKKNGRNGQLQNGVDISGHRDGENEYSGIQCKCKPGNKQVTREEIEEELNNARAFKPALRRLVFTTTADKDVSIEEYVRLKDDENRKQGLFSIDIKSWQDIIDLLERNKSVLNTYLDIVAEDYAVAITFDDGSGVTTIRPRYSHITYREPVSKAKVQVPDQPQQDMMKAVFGDISTRLQYIVSAANKINEPLEKIKVVRGHVETNHAYCPLKFQMVNQGRSPIDDYKVFFYFNNNQVLFAETNVEKRMSMPEITFGNALSNISMHDGKGISMFGTSLIPGDVTYTDDFFVHLPIGVQEVNIDWKLLSRHYSEKGTLKIIVEDEIQYDYEYSKARVGEEEMVDFVEKEDILG
jgi:hypothetical protein